MKKTALSASNLRLILLGVIACLILVGSAGVWYLQGILNTKVADATKIKAEATTSNNSLASAQALKIYLANHQEDISKTALLVADTTAYNYQEQIVKDITRYAEVAGLRILGFDFPTTTTKKSTTAGLNSISATVTLDNPVPYTSYLKFLKLIEQNLTKMQITDISITPDRINPSLINNPTVGIEVYTQ